ncbi:restriction endonuclease [Nesterenkonia natronophila]|nr:restriction endonuclease [Nesterenkonia natronophila]
MGTQEITLGHLLETYYRESNDYRDRGDKFERLVRSYLTTDPAWAFQFSDVWLWQDYPDRGTRTDTGVDLVAKDKFTGELTAIQCKFLDPENTVSKGDIDSFISASPKPEFSTRLLAHTAEIGPTAQKTLQSQDPPVRVLDPHQMDRADIRWAEFQVEYPDRMVQKGGKKTPFPYQRQAMADVAAGFQSSDRGKLIMACGTAKTFTSLHIMQDLTLPNTTV